MAIFLTLSTKDAARADRVALQLATSFPANVCYFPDKDGFYVVALKSDRLESDVANKPELLEKLKERIAYAANVTNVDYKSTIEDSLLAKAQFISNSFRTVIHFKYSGPYNVSRLSEFTEKLQQKCFTGSMIQLISSSKGGFEIRVNDRAAVRIDDIERLYVEISQAVTELAYNDIDLVSVNTSSESIKKEDYHITNDGKVNIRTTNPRNYLFSSQKL